MKATTLSAALIAMAALAQPVWAQASDSLAGTTQAMVAAAPPVHMRAEIVSIEPDTRTVTLKGEHGRIVVMQVSDQIQGFDKLKVGDKVDALYKNALLVSAEEVTGASKGIRSRVDTDVYAPASGGYESVHQIDVLATVVKIDHKKRLITLRGAYQTQTLEAEPDVDLKEVKVGDTIHAVFVSAAAVQITRDGVGAQ